jgi:hypothetical protein
MTEITVENLKFCIMLNLDNRTQGILRGMHLSLLESFPPLIDPIPTEGISLPYHKTIIGGVSLRVDEVENKLRLARDSLVLFSKNSSPKIIGLEVCSLQPYALGIRLKLQRGSYVITGNPQNNRSLAHLLGAKNFNFDLPHHVTLTNVKGGFEGIDTVRPKLVELLSDNKKDLMFMTFIPEIWEKNGEKWSKYELK